MRVLLAACDLLLLLGATLRTVRLIVADDIPGQWWIKDPLHRVKHAWKRRRGAWRTEPVTGLVRTWEEPEPRWGRYLEGLSCPFCVGLWIAAAMVLLLALLGGPGYAPDWWRIAAGILSLNWVAAHLGVRAGDTDD